MAEFLTGSLSVAHVITGSIDMILVPGAARYVDFDDAISESVANSTTRLSIYGTILCAGFDAISLQSIGAGPDLVVIGTDGQVDSIGEIGVRMNGDGARIVNDGQVSGATGMQMQGGLFGEIENSGNVTGIGTAAIRLISSNSVQIVNTGSLRGDTGILLDTSYAQILNSGRIIGTDPNAAAIDSSLGAGATVIRNTGVIEAQVTAIRGGASTENVVNTGDILGDVLLGGSDDVLRGRQGLVQGDIYGGLGNDLIISGRGDDFVWGDDGNDTLRGNAGDDVLYGGRGNDVVSGNEGDDTLYGGGNFDTFVFTRQSGDDQVADFRNGFDRIDMSIFHFFNFSAVSSLATDRIGGLLIDLRSLGGGTIFVDNFLKASFDAGDVIL